MFNLIVRFNLLSILFLLDVLTLDLALLAEHEQDKVVIQMKVKAVEGRTKGPLSLVYDLSAQWR